MDELRTFIAGIPAGTLKQGTSGELSFEYDDVYAGVPLSLSMPVSNRRFTDKTVRPFLFGLLPDNFEVRRSLGRDYGVSGNNPFALLSHIGLDCPGAIQFFAEFEDEAREEKLVPISDDEIAQRLLRGRNDLDASWETEKEHWSLGGQQSKFALREKEGQWFVCEGAAATTHIFKPGIPGLMLEALNEFICLNAAKECGLAAANASYATFCDEPAIILSRYDRVVSSNGNVMRLHQEDFCQALGVLPENKYVKEGGPNANQIIGICKKAGIASAENIISFIDMLFFNNLIGAPDAHAKNYSVLLDQDSAFLAPLYDVASMLPYTDRPFEIKTAMGIAGENRAGRISKHRLAKFVVLNDLEECEIDADMLAKRLETLASRLPKVIRKVFEANAAIPKIEELEDRFVSKVNKICDMALGRLDDNN